MTTAFRSADIEVDVASKGAGDLGLKAGGLDPTSTGTGGFTFTSTGAGALKGFDSVLVGAPLEKRTPSTESLRFPPATVADPPEAGGSGAGADLSRGGTAGRVGGGARIAIGAGAGLSF